MSRSLTARRSVPPGFAVPVLFPTNRGLQHAEWMRALRDGYAHRLRAIDHLHEAEDESQAWPELHSTIRAARKAYQTDGMMPDWEALAQLADHERNAQ